MDVERVEIAKIRMDGGTQPRATLNMFVIDEYAQAMRDGAAFPPVVLFYDGTNYWLADGFHRVKAGEQIGVEIIDADVRQGTQRDAILFSVGANASHGMRRTNEDKRRAVMVLLNDPDWCKWSDSKIARKCFVTHPFVLKLRGEASCNDYKIERTVQRGGSTYTMNVANIGERIAPEVREAIRFTGTAENKTDLFALARLDTHEQEQVAAKLATGDARNVVDARRQIRHEATRNIPLPTGNYRVIYADPPWDYANSGMALSAATYYPTMKTADICSLPISERCSPGTVLFLWATSPMLPDAMQIIESWGFSYKASFVWDKGKAPGIGWFVRTEHELLLVATRDANPHPQMKPKSIIRFPASEHSKKPNEVYEIIEGMYPGPYIELFARNERIGWASWGNEVSGGSSAKGYDRGEQDQEL